MVHWYEAFLGCFFYVAYVAMMGVNNQIMNGMDACANFALKTFPFLSILQDPEKKNETADPTNIEELNEVA